MSQRAPGGRYLVSVVVSCLVLLVALAPGCAMTQKGSRLAVTPQGELLLVGSLNVSAGENNITDLWAHTARSGRTYAYLGTFDEPRCGADITGVHIVDITDPSQPQKAGFVPTPTGMFTGDVMAAAIRTPDFRGDVLVHAVEFCRGGTQRPPSSESPGIILYDITDPLQPVRLATSFSLGFEVHTIYVYQHDQRAFVLVAEDGGERDFHIVDITDPRNPVEVSARGWRDWFAEGTDQLRLGAGPASFVHEAWQRSYPRHHPVRAYAGKSIAYLSYWDAGLVLLDITDPANPVFLGDSDYADPDPVTGQPPEGNSHSTVPSADGRYVIMSDEDFSTGRASLTINTGGFPGSYRAAEARFTVPVAGLPGGTLSGPATYIGTACPGESIPPPPSLTLATGERHIAVIERGGCALDDKVAAAARAGYGAAVVVGEAANPDTVTSMRGDAQKGTIPTVFVPRRAGFAILGISPEAPTETALPGPGATGSEVTFHATFDGWGYVRILDVTDPAAVREAGQFTVDNVMANPSPPGDHAAHNLVTEARRAYIAWYADGIRVMDFTDPARPLEVGRFVDEAGGSDFWGVYLLRHPDGNSYILGSDRDTGLWIFKRP